MSELYDRITAYVDARIEADGKDVFTSPEVRRLRVIAYQLQIFLDDVDRKLEKIA